MCSWIPAAEPVTLHYLYCISYICVSLTLAVSLKFCKNGMTTLANLVFIVFCICFTLLSPCFVFHLEAGYFFTFSASKLSLCLLHMVQRDKNCVFCPHWLQYSISHSLSTIQYVLVSQVQHQLQAEPQRMSRSGSCRISGPKPGSSFQLG